ncbi:MAG: PadR family transcriptional regulator [Fusobacteriaceae bacterium]
MSLKHGLLGLLNYGEMTGYELDKIFKDSLNFFWQAQMSQIYKELTLMEKKGWLTSEIIIQTDKPNKKKYSITEAGKSEFKNWLLSYDIKSELEVKSPFLMRLFFSGDLPKDKVIKMLEDYKESFEKSLMELKVSSKNINYYKSKVQDSEKSIYWYSAAMYGEFHYEMNIKWAKKIIQLLKKEDNL